MIKNFSLFKVKEKKNPSEPDYRISAKVGDKYQEVGAGWIKQNANGTYLSCSLSKPYKDRKGYQIVEETGPDATLGEVPAEMLPDMPTTSPKTGDFGEFPEIM